MITEYLKAVAEDILCDRLRLERGSITYQEFVKRINVYNRRLEMIRKTREIEIDREISDFHKWLNGG